MSTEVKRYLWEKEVKDIDGVIVTLEDDTNETLSEASLEYLITAEPQDATAQRDVVVDKVVADLLEVLEKHNIKRWDLSAIVNTFTSSYDQNFYKAVGKILGVAGKTWNTMGDLDATKITDVAKIIEESK